MEDKPNTNAQCQEIPWAQNLLCFYCQGEQAEHIYQFGIEHTRESLNEAYRELTDGNARDAHEKLDNISNDVALHFYDCLNHGLTGIGISKLDFLQFQYDQCHHKRAFLQFLEGLIHTPFWQEHDKAGVKPLVWDFIQDKYRALEADNRENQSIEGKRRGPAAKGRNTSPDIKTFDNLLTEEFEGRADDIVKAVRNMPDSPINKKGTWTGRQWKAKTLHYFLIEKGIIQTVNRNKATNAFILKFPGLKDSCLKNESPGENADQFKKELNIAFGSF